MSFFVSLLAGILIDIDHILDYYVQEGLSLKIKEIYTWFLGKKYRFLFLIFHSWELIFVFWLGVAIFKLGILWVALALGITQHMLLDIFLNSNFMTAQSYFLSFRIIKGFKKECLLRP